MCLKQAPRQWYERLSNFLTSQGYERGKVDKTLFIRKLNYDIILVQVYVDDIIFSSTNEFFCQEFVSTMQGEFEMSMKGELNFFPWTTSETDGAWDISVPIKIL